MAQMRGRQVLRAAGAAGVAAPYLRRMMKDADLRDDMRNLAAAAGHLYSELSREDRMRRLVNDRRIRKDVDEILESMQDAGQRIMKPRRHWGRNLLIVSAAGGTAAVFIYPRTRKMVLDRIGTRGVKAEETAEQPPEAMQQAA